MAIFSNRVRERAIRATEHGRLLTLFQYDEPQDALTVTRVQDVEPILEENKRLQNSGDGYSPGRQMRRVASIPHAVVEQWMREGVSIFDKNAMPEIRRRLNDPENLFLRTSPGRV